MLTIHDELKASFTPCSPLERVLLDQAASADQDRQECLRVRAALRADVLRTAEFYFEEAQEDEVARYQRMFHISPKAAVVGLKRSAAGCRWLIAQWERLEQALAVDGTWFGIDRIDAILFQGHSAIVDDLCTCEEAYMTWVHCLAAQPNPKQPDIDLVLDPRVMPKAFQDRDDVVWPRDPAPSRAALAAILARELPALRAREALLRVRYEEPARAAAKEEALARLACDKEEVALLRAQRGHEQSYQRACHTFLKVRRALAAEALRPGGTRGVNEDRLVPKTIVIGVPARRGCQPSDTPAPASPAEAVSGG
jgi:hypothetical protein